MTKHRDRANPPALPIISRRSMLAAPLVLLPSNVSAKGLERKGCCDVQHPLPEATSAQARILKLAARLLSEIDAIAPEDAQDVVCRVHRLSGPVTFEAIAFGSVIRDLNPNDMVWY